MKYIAHRVNTISQLRTTDCDFGVEVDIRSNGDNLVIHHDPFSVGEPFDAWLKEYHHGTLILNVKEEGLENSLLELMRKYKITDFLFLDQSFPFLIKTSSEGETRCAVRVSEYETVETALALAGKVDWIWVDCFNVFPLSKSDYLQLRAAGLKLCLVSPELQGRNPEKEISKLITLLRDLDMLIDAVCTKRIDIWEDQFCR